MAHPLDEMIMEFREFCDDNGLPQLSADEMLVENLNLKDWQIKYIENFNERWENTEE